MTRRAFTLVELLIVVGIMGLLATIGISAFSSSRLNARNMQRKATLAQVAKALEMYANDHGGLYPSTSLGWWGELTASGSYGLTGAGGYIANLAPTYIPTLPHDPLTGTDVPDVAYSSCNATNSEYLYRSNGTDYKLMTNCLAEGTLSASDPFTDTARPTPYYAWGVWSPGAKAW